MPSSIKLDDQKKKLSLFFYKTALKNECKEGKGKQAKLIEKPQQTQHSF